VQGTDALGRVRPSTGTAESSVEQTDWHNASEREFLKRLAQELEQAVPSGSVNRLIVVAPSRALGSLRRAYSPTLRATIASEISKDLVKAPIWEIERQIIVNPATHGMLDKILRDEWLALPRQKVACVKNQPE
jgi:protein required for attachment to host cells